MTKEWPLCGNCHKTILVHGIQRAKEVYCDPGKVTGVSQSTFGDEDIYEAFVASGRKIPQGLMDRMSRKGHTLF